VPICAGFTCVRYRSPIIGDRMRMYIHDPACTRYRAPIIIWDHMHMHTRDLEHMRVYMCIHVHLYRRVYAPRYVCMHIYTRMHAL
jgi:hypothetical protein